MIKIEKVNFCKSCKVINVDQMYYLRTFVKNMSASNMIKVPKFSYKLSLYLLPIVIIFHASYCFCIPKHLTIYEFMQIWISWLFCLGFVKYWSMASHLAVPTEFRNGLSTSLILDSCFWSEYVLLQRLPFFFLWISCSVSINYLLAYDSSSVSVSLSAHCELHKSNQEQSNLQFSPLSTFCLPVDSVCADIGSVISPFLIFLEYIN